MVDYDPATSSPTQVFPFEGLPSTDTPVTADWLQHVDDFLDDAGGPTGRLRALERIPVNAQSGTSYTLVLADAGKAVHTTGTTVCQVTVPPNAAVAFPLGTQIRVAQLGAGQAAILAGAGVTLRTEAVGLALRAQFSEVRLRKIGTNEWLVSDALVNTPAAIPGLSQWYDASTITGLADGAPIITVVGKASGAIAEASGTPGRPTYETNEAGGKPVMRFDGTDDVLISSADLPGGSFSMVFVLKPSGTGIRTIIGPESGTGTPHIQVDSAGKVSLVKAFTSVVGTATTALSTSAFSLAQVDFTTGVSYAFYLNGAADGGSTTTTTMTSTAGISLQIGRRNTAEPFAGDIAEIIVFTTVLSAGDRARVNTFLAAKYGIALS